MRHLLPREPAPRVRTRADRPDDQRHRGEADKVERMRIRKLHADAEHAAQIAERRSEVGLAEDHPADDHDEERVERADDGRQFLENTGEHVFLDHQQHAEIEAPREEVPRRPVPEARQRPHHQDVEHMARHAHTVAAKRNVDVVAEPRGERHVPAPPKFRDRFRDVGVIEVLLELEAEHAPEADRHVGVAAEVEVYLQGVGEDADPKRHNRCLAFAKRADRHIHRSQRVRQQHLLREPHHEALDAEREIHPRDALVAQLLRDVVVFHDRAGDELREHRDVEREVDDVAVRLHLAAVDVDQIRHRLEGEERDADRKRQIVIRDMDAEDVVDRAEEEAPVFEEAEHEDVDNEREDELRLRVALVSGDVESAHVVEYAAEEHEEHIHRLAPRIEEDAEEQQDDVLRPRRHEEIHDERARQKDEEEEEATEYH